MSTKEKTNRHIDYRHYICIAILLASLFCAVFVFRHAFYRVIESSRDFGLSFVFYFQELFKLPFNIEVTVNDISPHTVSVGDIFPASLDAFKAQFSDIKSKALSAAIVLLKLLILLTYLIPLIIIIYFVSKMLVDTHIRKENNKHNKDTKFLSFFKGNIEPNLIKVKYFIQAFVNFIKENRGYVYIFCVIWLWNFNIITIVLEFFAYLFYVCISYRFDTIYIQVYKLALDLYPMLEFVPGFLWAVTGYIVLDKVRRRLGIRKLEKLRDKNIEFLENSPIAMFLVAPMGSYKTALLTSMSMSINIMLRDKALKIIRDIWLEFPNFPFINFEKDIKEQIEKKIIFNLASARCYIRKCKRRFERISYSDAYAKFCLRKGYRYIHCCWEYDYKKYNMEYDNNLELVDLFRALSDYAEAFYIYIVSSALIYSNYSIRTDSIKDDRGNFIKWDNDIFERLPRKAKEESRYSNILDYDSLRLGKKVIEDNRVIFEFGCISLTELAKERGNQITNRRFKDSEEANPKNDLTNLFIKMIRHPAVIRHTEFTRILGDDQRKSSLEADANELFDTVHLKKAKKFKLAMPFFKIEKAIIKKTIDKFKEIYLDYRYYRGDNTLFIYLLKNILSKLNNWYIKIMNQFTYCKVPMFIESSVDEKNKTLSYNLMVKEVFSDRYATDCFKGYFEERLLQCKTGIEDNPKYKGTTASMDELKSQDSYFVNDLLKYFYKD